MAGISGVGPTMSAQQIELQRTVKTAQLLKDVTELQGDLALKLLDSAQVGGTGQNLNIQV
ncbi:MAG: hypothetical protein JNK74_19725 [Candidatus Hydrogenedentes bacterium]|nr:hypothetical protein [Candidatus Hydrogenedentota bacterium]